MNNLPAKSEQRMLAVLSSLSYRTGNLNSYLQEIAQGLGELLELDWSVVTFCQDGSERILASTIDLGQAANEVYSLHGSLTGTVVKTGSPLVVEDATTCTDYGEAPEGYRAYLGVPLQTATGDVIGTICSFQKQSRHFSEAEVQLAELFAERAATAIDNYQLYQQQQQFNKMLEAEIVKRTLELRAAQSELMTANIELEQRVRQRTAELQAAEAKFRALVEQAVDGFFIIDESGRFLDANQVALNRLGYSRDELLDLRAADVQKKFPAGGFAEVWQQMEMGKPVTIDGIHQRKDGTQFPVEVRCGLVEWDGKKVELALVRDITERKQAEEALRISEMKFATAFHSSPDAITISTLKDGRYIEVNDSCLRMLGYSREEMVGCSVFDLGVWEKPEDRDTMKQRLQEQGRVKNLEIRLRRKSGETFPALFSAEVIELEAEPCLLAVVADITMLKQAEEAMERLAEIGELAAMIVHEVRNPLTTISMGLNAFTRLQLPERFQEYLSLSLDEADRLQRLLNQILLYSKQQTLQRSRLELNQFVSQTLNAIKTIPAASEKHLELISVPNPVEVLADCDKLKQVLINLVTNACEAVSAGETVIVRIQDMGHHQVCIQVHNGGTPIPEEILPKLTKPFFTTKAGGTGLGLAIVRRIIEAHEGEFKIESSAATGTIVEVRLPLAPTS